jgi:hypothetical protein
MLHRAWLILLVAAQLTLLVLTPVSGGNDERAHFIRAWAIAEGHFNCDKVPQAVRDVNVMNVSHARFGDYWRRGLSLSGGGQRVDGHDYGCFYFPLAVALPGLVSRWVALDWHGEPRTGGVFISSYVARLVNLATVDAALLFFLSAVPWARSTALAFFAIPMVMEQSVCIDHDGMLMALSLVLCTLAFTRRDWKGVWAIALGATLMALIKPNFILFGLMTLPLVARLPITNWKERLGSFAAAAPAVGFALWAAATRVTANVWHPSFSSPKLQLRFLARHPWHLVTVFVSYLHYFIDDGKRPEFAPHRINGAWTTLYFSNLAFEMATVGCVLGALALPLAMVADCTSAPHFTDGDGAAGEPRRLRWARVAAVLGVASAIPATIIALYLIFSHVGSDQPFGVVGRYYAPTWIALSLLTVHAVKRRRRVVWRGSSALALAAAALGFGAVGYALSAYWRFYWG